MSEREATAARLEESQDKALQILRAARSVFMAEGYAAANMDAVARAAGVSKATLYVYFASKRDLFAAVILEERDHYSIPLVAGAAGQEDIRAKLLRFAKTIVNFLLSADVVGSCRMVIGESLRVPDLGQLFYLNGPAKLLERLEEFMAKAMKSGLLRAADPRRAAGEFIELVKGDLQLRALLGVTDGLSSKRVDAVIRDGVDTFFRAYQPEDKRLRSRGRPET